ncbi:GAF and ANTAR domain-containing protein [Frankia tisae]|uniref:GAF and ANTAR domain-containing protein n=1 Tax=Frankia tisae TaxID=2950104 RepID=UPI0021C20A94|nr:GAF and ANTAR domain-containing protein [Frankia tisae]
MAAGNGLAAADGLCRACVSLLGVDGAAVSVVRDGASTGTFGSSGALSRRLDELQFTLGEGPCLDAVREGRPALVPDLTLTAETRWPMFAGAVMAVGVRAVFALPVVLAGAPIGALDLFRHTPGPLGGEHLAGGLFAARLATLPLLDLASGDLNWEAAGDSGEGIREFASLERVEVYQATGMIMAQCDVGPAEALVRLRAYAFAHDLTASEAAWRVVQRQVALDDDSAWAFPDHGWGTTS